MGLNRNSGKQFVVLIAEDDDDEYALASAAFRGSQTPLDIRRAPDGQACLAYLRGEEPYVGLPFPDLLLLDINMPRATGFEVMAAIDGDEHLRHLPVVVLTSSSEPEDVERMYRLHCSAYVKKPMEFSEFQNTIRDIAQFWLNRATLPTMVR